MLIKVAKLWLPISFVVVVGGSGSGSCGGGDVVCVSTSSSGLPGFCFSFFFFLFAGSTLLVSFQFIDKEPWSFCLPQTNFFFFQ